jgi:tRNA-2-methylthio-N6-dimethylallyladenosine synthase
MLDDVPNEEKRRRFALIDDMQAEVLAEINGRQLGKTVQVLVEEEHRGKWRGRTPQNKLVFFEDSGDWKGKLAEVEITWTGPWSMQGRLSQSETEPHPVILVANDNVRQPNVALQ